MLVYCYQINLNCMNIKSIEKTGRLHNYIRNKKGQFIGIQIQLKVYSQTELNFQLKLFKELFTTKCKQNGMNKNNSE